MVLASPKKVERSDVDEVGQAVVAENPLIECLY